MSDITLICLVQGDKVRRGFRIEINQSATVHQLKEEIHRTRSFRGVKVDPHDLQVWKVEIPAKTLNQNDTNPVELVDGQELKEWQRISFYWENDPGDDVLSVIIRRPDGTTITPSSSVESQLSNKESFEDQHPSKRRRLSEAGVDEAIPEAFTTLWRTFWGRSATEFFIEQAVKIPDLRTLELSNEDTKFTYLQLPGDIEFPCDLQRILVTETYKSLYDDLCEEDSRWLHLVGKTELWRYSKAHSTVITGQPGIGKTTGLSYILVRRLQDKKPTVYCDDKNFAYIFTDAGVQKVSCAVQRVAALNGLPASCCALVNIHPGMTKIPSPFYPSSFRRSRVVVAASPNPIHVVAFKESRAQIYTLPTWGWNDLYCASMLINDPPLTLPNDEKLLDMFTIFRGIPRRCFQALFDEESELQKIKDAVDEIESITEFVKATSGPLPFKTSSSDILVRIEPTDGRWGKPVTEPLSNYVADLMYERMRLLAHRSSAPHSPST